MTVTALRATSSDIQHRESYFRDVCERVKKLIGEIDPFSSTGARFRISRLVATRSQAKAQCHLVFASVCLLPLTDAKGGADGSRLPPIPEHGRPNGLPPLAGYRKVTYLK